MGDVPSDLIQHMTAELDRAVECELSPDIDSAAYLSGVAAINEPRNDGDFGAEGPNSCNSWGGRRFALSGKFASSTSSSSVSDHRRTTESGEGDEECGALEAASSTSPVGLSRSFLDRVDAFEEFTPSGGSPMKEQEACEPVAWEYMCYPAVGSGMRFGAAFMLPGITGPGSNPTSEVATKRSCDFCAFKKRRCDGNTPCASCKTKRRKCVRSLRRGAKKRRKACDRCHLRRTPCDGKKRCASCKMNGEKCVRSASVKRDRASKRSTLLPGRDKSGQDNLEGSPLRCRRAGCLQLPQYGRQGGRALWCPLHYVSQNAHQPLRCPVLQQSASGSFLPCWRETTWGWLDQPPTRCEQHKSDGHQQQNLDEVVSVLKRVFVKVLWSRLLERGWHRDGRYLLPPDIVRGVKTFKARVDFFDTQRAAIKYCLRTAEHHEWMMEEYRKQTAKTSIALPEAKTSSVDQEPSSCAPRRWTAGLVLDPETSTGALQESQGMLVPGVVIRHNGITPVHPERCLQHERNEIPRQVSPGKARCFSHELFSVAPSPNQIDGDRAGGGDGN
ncbi:unnamed protein product [Scytosiphon promiscuus]